MIVWISAAVGLVALCLFTLLAYRGGHARLVEERKLSLCAPVLSEAELQSHLSRLGVGLALHGRKRMHPSPGLRPALMRQLRQALQSSSSREPGLQWLRDHGRAVEEQLGIMDRELQGTPALPALKGGGLRLTAFTDSILLAFRGQLRTHALPSLLQCWQETAGMTEEELQLLPQALRLTLLRLTSQAAADAYLALKEEQRGERIAQSMLRAHGDPLRGIDHAGLSPEAFAGVTHALEASGAASLLRELDLRLEQMGLQAGELVRRAQERQMERSQWLAALITSLRGLDKITWPEFLETCDPLHRCFLEDPSGTYAAMDFDSRRMYVTRLARLAQQMNMSQERVALGAVRLAQESEDDGIHNHVGYYLLEDAGLRQLYLSLRIRRASLFPVRLFLRRHSRGCYLSLLWVGIAVGLLLMIPLRLPWLLWPLWGLCFSELWRLLGQGFLQRWLPNRELPRLHITALKESQRTLVVLPTLLSTPEQAVHMIGRLSELCHADPDLNIEYMLLGDFADSLTAEQVSDDLILRAASSALEALQESDPEHRYLYLQRRRTYDKGEGAWIGRERKRGNLESLNRLIVHGNCDDLYDYASMAPSELHRRYAFVVTLDQDTELPPDTVRSLIGALSHPLTERRRVPEGWRGVSLVQPLMETDPATVRTSISWIMGGQGGVDPYNSTQCPFYQRLCGQGSFQGKGAYMPEALLDATQGWILPDTVLSHDLLEGELAGCAADGSLRLYDGNPATWAGWLQRLHRWTRGDWQLLPWLLPWVHTPQGVRRNPLGRLSRHKIWDNLRRSMLPLGLAGLLLYATLASRPGLFALLILLFLAKGIHCRTWRDWAGVLMGLITLPTHLAVQGDAILRALWRMAVSHEKRLNWLPTAQAELTPYDGLFLNPWPQWSGALGLGIACLLAAPLQWSSLPLAALFALFPLVLPRLDAPRSAIFPFDELQQEQLTDLAQNTWRFFESSVGPDTHYLPPDNVQLEPWRGPAMRTSPTNIGLYLLSAMAMVEMDLLEADQAATRIRATVETLEALPKWRGHLYNWYDLNTLEVLDPPYVSSVDSGNYVAFLMAAAQLLRQHLSELDAADRELPARMDALAEAVDLAALYDAQAQLFFVGFDTRQEQPQGSHYGLLASEARLLSFVAICTRQVPLRHFSRLSRTRVALGREHLLMSWSGTLFEYLMPQLLLPLTPGTLLHHACAAAVRCHIKAGKDGLWGMSESGYYAFDPQLNYQYRAFGLEALAADPDAQGKVFAPYAVALALSLYPDQAMAALQRMHSLGLDTPQGFLESIDLDTQRTGVPEGRIVRSHMAHHQGMLLCAVANALTGDALSRAFCRMPKVRAFLLLLREREDRHRPVTLTLPKPRREAAPAPQMPQVPLAPLRLPVEAALMGGGKAFLLQSAGGLGVMGYDNIFINRFTRDPSCREGIQFYLLESGRLWEPFDPRLSGKVWAEDGCLVYTREHRELRMRLTCFVDPVDQCQIHMLELENLSARERTLEVADYFELALAPEMEQLAHPTYHDLFIETAPFGDSGILAHRRRRDPQEPCIYLCHLLAMPSDMEVFAQTDREAFLGRNGSPWQPWSLREKGKQGLFGAPIHPCASLRCTVRLGGRGRMRLVYATYCRFQEQPPHPEDFSMDLTQLMQRQRMAQLRQQVLLNSLDIPVEQLPLVTQLTGAVQWLHQPHQGVGTPISLPLEELWAMGLSGDRPLLAVFLNREESPLLPLALHFTALQRSLGMQVELAIAVLEEGGSLLDAAQQALDASPLRDLRGKGVAIMDKSTLTPQRYALLHAAASLSLDDRLGTIREQLDSLRVPVTPTALAPRPPKPAPELPPEELHFFNGYGGFLADEGAYVIRLTTDRNTPAPWCNYLCRPGFGTLCCESGLLFTYGDNSHRRRLTPWVNDPVTPQGGEFLVVEDLDTGEMFSPTRLPFGQAMTCRVVHSPGVTVYRAFGEGLELQWTCFTDPQQEAGCRQLRVRVHGNTARHLCLHACLRFVMGTDRRAEPFTCLTPLPGMVLAVNPGWPCLGFLADLEQDAEAHRMSPAAFQGLWGQRPWGLTPPKNHRPDSAEPCVIGAADRGNLAVLTRTFTLEKEGGATFTYLTGLARDPEEIEGLLERYRREGVSAMQRQVQRFWSGELSAFTCHVPWESLSLMLNLCLPYQVRVARLWARAGLYQAGGAIGFRDQLQDMTALIYTNPEEVRRHLLLCASRQYEAGDVQHWWHPGHAGVRTRITDDRLFLPFMTAWYIRRTGDVEVLAASAPFLVGADIPPGKHDLYHFAAPTAYAAPLMEHCLRAIRSLRFGPRHIPLMEGGDWNDGMNRVEGESVFLGFFLCRVLDDFAPYCETSDAQELRQIRASVLEALEAHAWDGAWYVRAWYPDGRVLGSHESPACQIDLLSQCWAVLGGALPQRSSQALESALERLHRPELGLTALLTPPFSEDVDAGYISGYLPGVRENGGQYTHALPWFIWALAEMGQTDLAWALVGEALPIHHSDTQAKAECYRLEPYFTAGDIYTAQGQQGRGGWSAYTGSAAWLYTVILEQLLGFKKQGTKVSLRPRLPEAWDGFALTLRIGQTTWHLQSRRDVPFTTLDGEKSPEGQVELVEDGKIHEASFPLR